MKGRRQALAIIVTIILVVGIVGWKAVEVVREEYFAMTRPHAEDRAQVDRLVEMRFEKSAMVKEVPWVDRDINGLFALLSIGHEGLQKIGNEGRARPDIGSGVFEFTLRDPEGHDWYALVRQTAGSEAFLSMVPEGQELHVKTIEGSFMDDSIQASRGEERN